MEIFGLNEKESMVYLASLELGEATGFQIFKKTSLKKPTVYYILDELLKKGLVSLTKKGSKKYFVAENPRKIKNQLEENLESFKNILPQLLSVYNISDTKPKLRYYEGKNGLKEVYSDTLKYRGEILAFASEEIISLLGEDFTLDYVNKRVKKGITIKTIIPESDKIKENFINKNTEQLRTTKFINPKEFNFPIEINIYGNKVAFMSFRDELAIIIESKEISTMMKNMFSFFWSRLNLAVLN